MADLLRDILVEPMIRKSLSVQVVALTLTPPVGEAITGTGLMKRENDKFVIDVIHTGASGAAFRALEAGFKGQRDKWKVTGIIHGVLPFETDAYVDSNGSHLINGGPEAEYLRSRTMHLKFPATGCNDLTAAQLNRLFDNAELGEADADTTKFSALLVYHGVKLCLQTHKTDKKVTNDFLGELGASGALDTHMFNGDGYQGALIQRDEELHLYLRSSDQASRRWTPDELEAFVDDVNFAVALAHDCQPWPCSRVTRMDHRITRQEVVAHTHLRQGVSRVKAIGAKHGTSNAEHVIPMVVSGLARLRDEDRKMLRKFHWQLHATDASVVPFPVRLLVKCSALEGLLKVILGIPKGKDLPRKKTDLRPNGELKSAFEVALEKVLPSLGLTASPIMGNLYDIWNAHRNPLAHGWLDFGDENSLETEIYHDRLLLDAYYRILFSYLGFQHPIHSPAMSMKVHPAGQA